MNSILLFTYPFGILAVLALVVGLGVYLTRKYNFGWRLFWIGAALFIAAQVLHIPFNVLIDRLFRNGILPNVPEQYQLLFSAVFLGLSAGLFEEITRYAGLRWWAKDARSWAKGLLFGSGWGGMEAIIFFAIPLLLNYGIFLALRNQDISGLLPPDQLAPLQQGLELFWGVAWYDSLLGAAERIMVIPIQISFTILVLQVFLRGQSRWLWIAILWHALLDAVAVVGVRTWGAYITEALVLIFSLVSLGMIFALRSEEQQGDTEVDDENEKIQTGQPELPPIEETEENIDQTRFTD
jgi:uncharacterized membrane protein YhfC